MMIIEMPFQQRLYAATDKSPEPREMAAWDMERLRLEELSISDFEHGADLVDAKTFLRGGEHWASLVGAVWSGKRFHHSGGDELSAALASLVQNIDCSRFFAEGYSNLPQTSIMRKPPKVEHIRSSQREVNVANLSAWVQDNLVSVAGDVFVRVREPAVYLDFIGPFYNDNCYMHIRPGRLSSASASEDHGILSTINGRHELLSLAQDLLASDERLFRLDIKFENGVFDKMDSRLEDTSDIAARTLVTQARRLSRRNYSPESLRPTLVKEFKKREREFDQERLDYLAELLTEHQSEMGFPASLMTEITLDRWNNRPIDLGLGVASRQTPKPH